MDKNYTHWVFHGEDYEEQSDDDDDDDGEGVPFDGLHDMLEDLQAPMYNDNLAHHVEHGESEGNNTSNATEGEGGSNNSGENIDPFDKLLSEARQPLYPGCKFSNLDYLIINRWSNKSFTMILQLIKASLPEGETLPKSHYEAKALM
ncbi:hypothetical protein GIB67_030226, partial [Kingdonia uniflora]